MKAYSREGCPSRPPRPTDVVLSARIKLRWEDSLSVLGQAFRFFSYADCNFHEYYNCHIASNSS
jgi:hypothetical protein